MGCRVLCWRRDVYCLDAGSGVDLCVLLARKRSDDVRPGIQAQHRVNKPEAHGLAAGVARSVSSWSKFSAALNSRKKLP